ncbi:MAG: sugar phosphate isomerase/epimerase [Ktedonobacterales bacterium]|nr:sugar phosphate isomerase/epimerase [Ktedonobacterales bacterium]
MARHGVPIVSVHPPLRPFPGWPRAMTERVQRTAAAARRLNASVYVVHPAMYTSKTSPRAARFAEALRLGREAAGNGVGGSGGASIALENNQYLGRRRRWVLDDLEVLTHFARDHGCGITLDTCHIGANGEDLLASYQVVRPLLRNIHLSDMRWRNGEPQTHLLPGEGELPLARFLAALADDHYDGLVTLEIHPLRVGLFSREHAERRLGQALNFVRAAIGQTAPPLTGI